MIIEKKPTEMVGFLFPIQFNFKKISSLSLLKHLIVDRKEKK